MKSSLLILLLLLSGFARSYECESSDKSIEDHWGNSEDVFFARVLSSHLVSEAKYPERVEVKVKVLHVFKGNPQREFKEKIIPMRLSGEGSVGMNSIFFGSEGKYFAPCTKRIIVNPGYIDLQKLIDYTDRVDISYAKDIESVLVLSGEMP